MSVIISYQCPKEVFENIESLLDENGIDFIKRRSFKERYEEHLVKNPDIIIPATEHYLSTEKSYVCKENDSEVIVDCAYNEEFLKYEIILSPQSEKGFCVVFLGWMLRFISFLKIRSSKEVITLHDKIKIILLTHGCKLLNPW